jgi:predicted AAA+ superfamily ATPase
VLSYTKMLGQLHDGGNTTTLAHYLDLFAAAGMLTGLPKYAGKAVRQRASSPKLQVMNTALLTATAGLAPREVRADREFQGRLVESAVAPISPTRRRAVPASCSTGASATTKLISWHAPGEGSLPSR